MDTRKLLNDQIAFSRSANELAKAYPRPELTSDVIRRRYWNANGCAISAVAVKGQQMHRNDCAVFAEGDGDELPCNCKPMTTWCAYIGATTTSYYEEDTVNFTRSYGTQMDERLAKAMFPELAASKEWRFLPE